MGSKAIVQPFVDAVNNQDWQAIETLVAESFARHSFAAGEKGVHSRMDLINFLRAEYITFPDANEQIVDILGEGDKVAVRMRFRGTQAGILGKFPPTGKVFVGFLSPSQNGSDLRPGRLAAAAFALTFPCGRFEQVNGICKHWPTFRSLFSLNEQFTAFRK